MLKFNLKLLGVVLFGIISNLEVLSQVSINSNTGAPTDYVGWAAGNNFALQFRHEHNSSFSRFEWYTTNGGVTSERMRLTRNGYLGIGITAPASVLHVSKNSTGEMFRTNGGWSMENRWRLFTTDTSDAIEQFRLYVPDSTSDVFLQAQQGIGNLSFNTAGGSNTNFPDTKLRIFPDDIDRIVAFENPNPLSFVPAYNAKFIINDRNATSSSSTLDDDALLLRVQGIGKLLPGRPIGLPAGASMGNFTMAEIISTRKNVGDAGLRLQGSRTNCNACDIGFIDFANYDDIPPSSEILFNMARLASGSQARDSSRGFIRFYTNDGTGNPLNANDAGLLERMRINGFGDGFFNLVPVNGQANMMNITARFNILDDDRPQLRLINFANNQNIAKIYTNLQTTDDGDLFLQPLDETQPEDSLYARFVGIHNPQPQNTLDIQSTKASPRWNELSTYGTSGLRFSNLSASNSPMTNLGKGVLAVDSNGNVVYVNAQSGFATCEDSINGVLNDYSKLDLNNYNFYFTNNDSLGTNHVGIGYLCEDALPAKLSVIQVHPADPAIGTLAISAFNNDNAAAPSLTFTGTNSEAVGFNLYDKGFNVGGSFSARNAFNTRGVVANIQDSPDNKASAYAGEFTADTRAKINVGVIGSAYNSDYRNIGVAGIASPLGLDTNILAFGVYGSAQTGGINYAGYFNGNVFSTGTYTPSDQNLKQNIQDFTISNDILSQLHPVSYDFKITEYPQMNLESGQQIGFLSQELEQVLPNAVKESRTLDVRDENGEILFPEVSFKAVAYEKLIPILVGGHQAQSNEISQLQLSNDSLRTQNQNILQQNQILQQQILDLNNRFSQLESCLQAMLPGLCEINHGIIQQNSTGTQEQYKTTINVKLSDKNTIVLNQNVPNPFAESTVINYSIPATVVKAQIHFYDGQGKLINSVEITNRGAGQLNVFGEDLSTGTYTYTLVADGQIVSTKKMVKE